MRTNMTTLEFGVLLTVIQTTIFVVVTWLMPNASWDERGRRTALVSIIIAVLVLLWDNAARNYSDNPFYP